MLRNAYFHWIFNATLVGETRYEPLYATPSEALARCFEDGCYSPELIFVISGKFEFVPYGLGRFATLPGTKTRVLKTMPVEIVAEKTVRASINPSCKVPGLTGVNVLYKNWLTTVESRNAPAVWAWGGNTSIAIRDALGVEPFSCSNLEEENAWLQCSK